MKEKNILSEGVEEKGGIGKLEKKCNQKGDVFRTQGASVSKLAI